MTLHIYFYVLSELIKRLKPPPSPGSRGLHQGGSHGLELDHDPAKCAEGDDIYV